jgi:hypothetical protein
MAIDRRDFGALLAAGLLLPRRSFAALPAEAAYVTTRREAEGFAAVLLDRSGQALQSLALPGRGHGAAVSPDGRRAVLFARRPGSFALVLDLVAMQPAGLFQTPDVRHFFGHGFFSPDGRILYACENDFEGERGVLGLYDAHAGFRRLGELDAGGIGVHEALLLKGGRLAALAIGGIATHPDYPREKLNLATMEPGIAYLDLATGGIVEKRLLPRALHQLSLRHLAEDASGCLWLGGQYEGAALEAPPLVARHRPGGELEMLEAPEESYRALRNYVGSVATNASGERVAVSSPRGGRVLVWEAASGRLLEERAIDDVCGLAAAGPAFLESDGKGRLWRGAALLRRDEAVAWDNHLTAVSAG